MKIPLQITVFENCNNYLVITFVFLITTTLVTRSCDLIWLVRDHVRQVSVTSTVASSTSVSTVTQYVAMANTVLPQLTSQASPKTKPSTTTGMSAPKQKKTTKTTSGRGGTRKRKSDVDPLAPKKPSNAFFWFCQEYRPGLQEHFKGEGMSGQHDLTKILAKLWSETKMEDRKVRQLQACIRTGG